MTRRAPRVSKTDGLPLESAILFVYDREFGIIQKLKAPAVLDTPRSAAGDRSAYNMTVPHRVCTRCQKSFPATSEFFNKNPGGAFGLKSWCRNCQREKSRHRMALRRADPEYTAKEKAYKRQPEVKERANELERERYRKNPQHFCKRKKAWRDANPEKTKEIKQRHFNKNPDRYRMQWRIWASRRRALKRNTPKNERYTPEQVERQLAAQHGKCWWCANDLNGIYEIDHRIPLSLGGSDKAANIVCSCPTCNRRKYKKLPWEFLGRLL